MIGHNCVWCRVFTLNHPVWRELCYYMQHKYLSSFEAVKNIWASRNGSVVSELGFLT